MKGKIRFEREPLYHMVVALKGKKEITVVSDRDIVNYLLETGKYKEALIGYLRYKQQENYEEYRSALGELEK